MKKIFFTFLLVPVLFSCKQDTAKGFEVSGHISNGAGRWVYLQETPLGSGERSVSDSTLIGKDGTYTLKGKAQEQSLFSIFFKSETYPFAIVVNDASKITVNADAKNPSDYQVSGSPTTKSLKDFSATASQKWTNLYYLGREMDSLKTSGASDSLLSAINNRGSAQLNDLQQFVRSFIKNSTEPVTSVWALGTYSQVFSMPDYQELLNGVVEKFPKHKGIAAIKELNERQLALAKQKTQSPEEPQWVGRQAPDLSLPDMDGKRITLNSFRGKYVLVDFWASWCLPCRRENSNIVQVYKKYKDKNFTILGVSLDNEKGDWKDAVENDNLSWTQVSDLMEWQSAAVSAYGFNGLPFSVLVDPQGKVIAQSLRGEQLELKLEEVLK